MIAPLVMMMLAQPLSTTAIPNHTPIHLGIAFNVTHAKELQQLQHDQQDPRSPAYRRWLSPGEFGERFGQSTSVYRDAVKTLRAAGLEITEYPNRLFIGAQGSAAQVEALLGVQLAPVEGQPVSVHVPVGDLRLPPALAGAIHISGLDTRVRTRHHIALATGMNSMGPQDLRRFYGADVLHARGYVGQGQKLAVLSTALAPGSDVDEVAIRYFFTNISNASAQFIKRVMPNPQQDYDTQPGGAGEFELDVEMQTVGAPGADSITLVAAPASEVFTTGANEIANNLPSVTAVSISLGICEPNGQQAYPQEFTVLRNAVTQGTVEGQTWSAATGDNGADDCRMQAAAAADFPSTIPEMMALGGTSIPNPPWSGHALLGYSPESVWNDGQQGGAAGGGLSIAYARPAYQLPLGLSGTGRSVPDISLIAGLPGVAVSSANPPGPLTPAEGTSVSSPLSAGFFALMASTVGCHLGDIHEPLYALGQAQFDGGAQVFHDITTGSLTYGAVAGPQARVGYDSATGWGSINVAALAAAWPTCPAFVDAGVTDGGFNGAATNAYQACQMAGCDAGCTTLPNGPSTCSQLCQIAAPNCATGTVCGANTVFSTTTRGECVPGCNTNADCVAFSGTVCSTCVHSCVPEGSATARVGDACNDDSQCPSGGYCAGGRTFADGYCTFDCQANVTQGACACPSGSQCGVIGRFNASEICLQSCTRIGAACSRAGYVCQQQTGKGPACLPTCTIRNFGGNMFDTCLSIGSNLACDVASGICGGPRDAGPDPVDAGGFDAGEPCEAFGTCVDAGPTMPPSPISLNVSPDTLGTVPGGCGCQTTSASPWLLLGLAMLLRRRVR